MGAISDGSFREVANYNKQRRAAYTLQNGGGVETHNPWGAALATALPSLFMTLGSKLGNMYDSEPVDDGEDSSALAESIQADIKTELKKVECTDISEVQPRLQLAQSGNFDSYPDITEKESKLANLNETYTQKSNSLTNTNDAISSLYKEAIALEQQINYSAATSGYSVDGIPQYTETELQNMQSRLKTLNNEIKEKEAAKKELESELTDLKNEQNTLSAEISNDKAKVIETLQESLDNLTVLKKQLKKAEGRDAIEELTNDETKSFTSELKKLQEAIKSGNQDSINKHASKLEEAYDAYKEAHPGVTNKTIEAGYKAAEKYIPKK